jgi:enamine deaminase RidA (YjgF/YER057c/UK114 family)
MKEVEALLAAPGGLAGVARARGARGGPGVFVSGAAATDERLRFAQEVKGGGRPLSGEPRWYLEARLMYARAAEALAAGGADFARTVRTDQYFPDWRAVPFLHQARREHCGNNLAPSTSVLVPRVLPREAAMAMEVLAVRADSGMAITPVFPAGLDVPSTSSFVPVATAGDHVFVAGFLAAWQPGDLGGIAPEAKVPEGHLWKGNRIQLEADYIIRRKLIPALEGAGSGLADVVKAQVYLADVNDIPAFNQVWARHFGANVPATTFIPTANPGFAIADARCEINLVALKRGGATKKILSRQRSPAVCDGHPVAVKAGDLLCFSGLAAADDKGPVGRHKRASGIAAEMEYLLDIAESVCAEFGTSLENLLRVQQIHVDLADFAAAAQVWKRRLKGRPLPLSALQVPPPLVVPGCRVQLDLWVYAPV